jgi:hypothetical protein
VLEVPGRHNVSNALGAIAAAAQAGVPVETAVDALRRFQGASRRFAVRGEAGGVLVVDDYAHNPVKVAAVIRAAREGWPHRRLIVLFQPHRFSRTRTTFAEYGGAFQAADEVVVTEIYAADEAPLPGVSARLIVDEIARMPPEDPNGRFTIAKDTSENWETNRLVRQISRYLGISRNRISFAGTKDKRAITSQLMCFEAPLEAVAAISMHQVRVENAYRSRKHITIGDLIGNSFQLKVRDCSLSDGKLSDAVQATHLSLQAVAGFPNFFGVQVAAVALASVWAFVFTYLMLWVINKITPVRVTKKEEELGLDESEHGETAYQDDDGLSPIKEVQPKKKKLTAKKAA